MRKRFSIITVAKNSENYIRDCLVSVANQCYDFEHILVDGSSTDNTLNIARSMRYDHLRIISQKDSGIYDAMNYGINVSKGDIIGILNSDDIYYNSDILKTVDAVFNNSQTQSCYGDLVYVSKNNLNKIRRYWKAGSFSYRKMYLGWMVPHPTFFVKRSVYETHGLFKCHLGSSADYELILRFLLKENVKTIYIPKVLVKMRLGGISNRSLKNRLNAHAMDYLSWKVNDLNPFPWTVLLKPMIKIPQYVIRPSIQF